MKTLVRVNPLNDIRTMDEMFERLFARTPIQSPMSAVMPIDVFERNGKFTVRASVPGIDPQNLDVQIEGGVLTITGEVQHDYNDENIKVYRREVSYGSFVRSIRLPEELNLEEVDAEFKNGFVTISIPRIEPEKPKALKVNVRNVTEAQSEPTIIQSEKSNKK